MASTSMDLRAFVGKLLKEDASDILRDGIKALAQMIIDVEVSAKIGAEPSERTDNRVAYRNGYRTRTWDTRSAPSSLRSPRSQPAATSPRCSIRGSALRERSRR